MALTSLLNPKNDQQLALIAAQGRAVTYATLRQDIQSAAAKLQPRSMLFIVGHNDYSVVRWYLAAFEYQHVVMLLPADIAESELTTLLDLYQPRYLLLPPTYAGSATAVWLDRRFTPVPLDDDGYLGWQNQAQQPILHPELAFLTSTSGSTGAPKLVRLSRQNLLSNASAIAQYLELTPHERAIAHLPLSYSFGLSVLNSHLIAGASVVLTNASLMARDFWQAVAEHQVTGFSGVPYHYEMLLKLRFARMNLHQIRTMTQAGGALAVPLLQQLLPACTDKGIRLVVMYGQTEASPRISYVPPAQLADKLGTIGIAIPGGQLWLRDEQGQAVTDAVGQGELMYQGDNVCLGYATSAADLARGDDNQQLLATGDLARRDADGFYYLTGRLKRFLKVFGNRISLDQVEQLLARYGWSAVAAGQDDALTVYLARVPTATEDEQQQVRQHLAQVCGIHFSAIRTGVIDAIPRLVNGKVDYQCLPPL